MPRPARVTPRPSSRRPKPAEAPVRKTRRNVYRRRPLREGRLFPKVLYGLLGLAGLAGLGLGLVLLYYQLLTWSVFCIKDIKNIQITGTKRLSPAGILELAKLGPRTSLLALRPLEVERTLRAHPWIAKVELKRQWPNRLSLHLTEREPVALVQLDDLYYTDRSGFLFKPLSPGDPHDFPIITGLRGEHFRDGQARAPVLLGRVMELLDLLKEIPPPLKNSQIAEIHVDPERGFTLYLNGLKTALDFGFDDLPGKIQKLGKVWPVLVQQGYLAKTGRINLDHPQRVILSLRVAETNPDGQGSGP